jgi:DNA-binding PadR family transcriptional regulator
MEDLMSEQFGDLGRWSDPAVLVLSSLAGGQKHGYAIVADVAQMSGVHLGPGTLYGVLARLEQLGLIAALPAEGRRRPYRMTAEGERALERQLTTIGSVARAGLARLRAGEALT